MAFRPCLIVPIYNNRDTIRKVVESLAYLDLTCIIVDDGSDEATQHVLQELAGTLPWVTLIRRSANEGKGAAMARGFRAASEAGFTHAVQVDADGQHDARDVPRFLEQAKRRPEALILGRPIFGEGAPMARRIGRFATHFWVWIETLSLDIKDALYGFRCYPLEPVAKLYEQVEIGHGMVFDTEIAVRLHWQGVPMINVDTRVDYVHGGLSHFHYFRDNVRIFRLHTMLFFGMLIRLPRLVFRTRT
jgi:glycosyltransferase involved in cell wall biosynthesis